MAPGASVPAHWTYLPVAEADAIWPSQCERLLGITY
jgi:hypothetical protein